MAQVREQLRSLARIMETEADRYAAIATEQLEFHWEQRLHGLSQKLRDAAVAARQAAR